MFEIQHYTSFVLAIVVFQLVPGPGTIAILNATARNGRIAGMAAVAGTLLGDFVFMIAAVAGLAAVMKANPVVFSAVQWFGAAYLCWIGLQLVFRKVEAGAADGQEPRRSPRTYFRQAFTVSLTNPKVILFFVSFFPLFLKPGAPVATLVLMMLHVTVLSLAYQAALVLAGNAVAARLRSLPSARKVASRLAGMALVGFGIKLATENR
jgi:threonine/homoserine/homoserine lactone efflux protein